ncbi:MAG: vanadium-dependent haloperoxidase [Ilumatobacteraceae bacterium]
MDRRRFLAMAGVGVGATVLAPLGPLDRANAARPATAAGHDADVALAWFDQIRRVVQHTPGFTPPVASRAFGYSGVTLYEALVPGLPEHRSLAGLLTDLPPTPAAGRNLVYDWPTVANAALAHIARQLFPTAPAAMSGEIDALETAVVSHRSRVVAPGVMLRSARRGGAVADAVFDWARTDGGHDAQLRNFPANYVAPTGDGLWRPTPPTFQPALQPTWGTNRPFALAPDRFHDPGPPTPYSADPGSQCYADALEVYDTVNQLTAEQRAIALFWSDDPGITDTPPGHSLSILTQVLRINAATLDAAAEAYAKVGIAVADAFIACWDTKYRYNLLRPITYINDHIDDSFGPEMPLRTPPFPEYTSGHSVQAAATATVLTDLLGMVTFTDDTHHERGLPARTFHSFEHAATEAAVSRLYGGIHYRPAIEHGLAQGQHIGDHINRLPLRN